VTIAEDWALLGIDPTDDRRAVKRAYARALKAIDVEADPARFVRLREALEAALTWGTQTPWWELAAEPDDFEADPDSDVESVTPPSFVDAESFLVDFAPRCAAPAGIGDARLREACDALEALLTGPDAADPAAVQAAGEAVFAATPGSVDDELALEEWTASLLAGAIPRSDPILEAAAARFGWRDGDLELRGRWEVQAVMERRAALAFLAACRRGHDGHRRAVDELSGPPRTRLGPTEYGLIAEVEDFLVEMDSHHPALAPSFPTETLDWWQTYLDGPHPPRGFWKGAVLLPAFGAFGTAIALSSVDLSPLWGWAVYAALLPATILWLFASGRRRWRRRRYGAAEPGWRFVALALTLPPLTTLLPANGWPMVLTWLPALGIFFALLRLRLEQRHPGPPFLPLVALASGIGSIVATQSAGANAMVPLPTACILAWLEFEPIQLRLLTLSRRARLGVQAAALVACIAVPVAALLAAWPPGAFLLLCGPGAVLAAYLAGAGGAGPGAVWSEWPVRVAAIVLYTVAKYEIGTGGALLLAVQLYGLGCAAARLGAAMWEEARAPAEWGGGGEKE